MLALVLMVGIVIDDAIVVLENIFRFIEEKRMTPFEAAREATAEIAPAGAGDDAEPGGDLHPGLVHVEHLAGASSTSSASPPPCAILVSLLVSFTLTPMMSARMFRRGRLAEGPHPGGDGPGGSREGLYGWVDHIYCGACWPWRCGGARWWPPSAWSWSG